MRGHRDLRLVIRLAIACAVVALLAPWEALRVLAAVPLCLVLPGYALTSAAFGPRPLTRGRFAVLTLGMSLIALVLCALLLNYVPGGIRDLSWAIVLVVVVIAASRLAAIERKSKGPAFVAAKPLRASRADLALLGGGLVAAIVALIVSATLFSADDVRGYTRLSMLPNATGTTVRIGVASNERHRTAYRLMLRLAGRDLMKRTLSLDPGEEREVLVRIPPTEGGQSRRVAASLYRMSAPGALFRRVTSWVGPDQPTR